MPINPKYILVAILLDLNTISIYLFLHSVCRKYG